MKHAIFSSIFILALFTVNHKKNPVIGNKWQHLKTIEEKGLLGDRTDLWRNKRLWFVQQSDFLLSGFESPPGEHLWQGEHVGKWLNAAVLDYDATKDPRLKKALTETVERLLRTQQPNGYMGTYSPGERFYNKPGDLKGWDIWTQRYDLIGLLVYEEFFPDQRVVDACKKMTDLLIEVFGSGKNDITKYGTRKGMSSTTLLESVVMLYERTGEKKYLDFAEQIVKSSEENDGLRLMGTMLSNGSVVRPGDGKAYQLMSNLLGYLRLYKNTNNEKYLQTVLNAWKQISKYHILVTGGPWTRKMDYNANKECFANQDAFDPWELVVENCCTVTWIQLNTRLLELTGETKYADEAERAMFNQFFGGQYTDGIDWCYYTKPNETTPPYVSEIHCCASSGPRALEMYYRHLAGNVAGILSVNSFSPSQIALKDEFGKGFMEIKSNFPFEGATEFHLGNEESKTFTIEFRLPSGTSLQSVKVNGQVAKAGKNERGFYQVRRQWSKGDIISIDTRYELEAHIQQGQDGKKWVAFTYGPFALAEKITAKPFAEPFKGIARANDDKLSDQILRTGMNDARPEFKIKDTNITLIPYYQAGSRTSGPRTYFEID